MYTFINKHIVNLLPITIPFVSTQQLDSESEKENSVGKGLERAQKLLENLEVEEPYWIKPYTDFDGPVRTRGTGEEEFHDGVKESFERLVENGDILNPGIISGRGMGYLLGQLEKMDITEIDIAGEMGAAYFPREELEDQLPQPQDASKTFHYLEEENIFQFNSILFDRLAEEDRQLMFGDNFSHLIGSACIEAYGVNLPEQRFSVEDTVYPDFYDRPTSKDVQDDIKHFYNANNAENEVSDNFEFHGDTIRFDGSPESVEALTYALAFNPFLPWGFQKEGDYTTMYPEYRADNDFSLDDFENFVSSTIQEYNRKAEDKLWFSTYQDYSFDYGMKGYEDMKTKAAQKIIDESGISEPVIVTNTGDKPTDVLEMSNSIFFAQEGTEAEEYCDKNDIPYVPVKSAAESFAIQEELAYQRPPPNV